ncbi:phospholipid carrier-dependent glycosyltransferase [candidate division KSB1 bacterium]|nr:phospholipid carrier-dependent glycosyltransferase [candidate division KSB1 bacterium]
MNADSERLTRKYFLTIISLGFILRFVGIWYGLPDLYNSDEPFNVANALSYGTKKSLEPTYFVYPTLYSYFLFAVYSLYFLVGKAIGVFESALDFGVSYFLDPTGLFFVGRLASVLLGAATIFFVYKIGRRYFSDQVGLLSAIMLTLSYTHADRSHWILLEPAVGFMCGLSLYLMFRFSETKSIKWNAMASLVCGLAISTKYNAGFIVVPLLVVIVTAFKHRASTLFLNLALSFLLILGGFLLGTPYWVSSFSSFWADLRYTMAHVGAGMAGHLSAIPLIWPLWELSFQDWTVGILMVAGLIYAFFQKDKKQLLLLMFVLPTLLLVGVWNRAGIHYIMPIFPALAVLGAVFLNDIFNQIRNKHFRVALITVLMFPAFYKIAYQDIRLTQPDTRTIAKKWIESNIPHGSSIAYENYVYGPNLFDARRFLRNESESGVLPTELKERLLQEQNLRPSYLLINLRKDFKSRISSEQNHDTRSRRNRYIRQLLDNRLPKLSSVKKAGISYLLASSDNYARYFEGTSPEKGTALWLAYQNGKRFYENVFNSPDLALLKEFRPTKWNLGPIIRIYKLE